MKENWKEKIQSGDITKACKRANISQPTYARSRELPPEKWTPAMVEVNKALKDVIEEREAIRAEFINAN